MIRDIRERGVMCDGMRGMCDGAKPWRKKEGLNEVDRESGADLLFYNSGNGGQHDRLLDYAL